ncbi:acyl-CoA dehydrogenase family protein [Mycobacterium paraseoulense]|uniref:Acyl-CoA dehydrogenase n=1 Tax=Mycobacterium paraseoulense TaxID=590652 RepID=A0A1X0I8K1_9MYCO|nr:acyl-CoA dehydrogenase family protein [Mycobacterium paraseoulense]MCV7395057.1 acyl-CoA/acyl-ACP dehydrogenase [Mycobacterium paraseoulense]ORB39136.1 acyl-CoA dehydrogenase [Mycobacterium paraseoulense]BBZ71434.1 putative acyl-CoA dehydrogenase [Mycobacterium paraseoulense]
MDFSFSEEQETISKLAREVLERRATPERLTELEAGDVRFDDALWKELAAVDLLGTALPESVGGNGGGFVELGVLLAEVGWAVAPVPVYATLALGADPIARHGNDEQRQRFLPGLVAGNRILTAGLAEPGRSDATAPATTARRDGGCWRLDGAKELVPAAQLADTVLIPASMDDGQAGLFLVAADARGIEIRPAPTTNHEPHADVYLDGATVSDADLIVGAELIDSLYTRALVALCAVQLGVVERALRIAAEYTTGREQFGRPIGSFQAVQQRMADAFIDVEAIRWTTWHAAWLLAHGRPAERAARIAKFWAAEAGARVAATAQHVHGGIGIDITYPLHRYFLWAKHNELTLGPAAAQLAQLGATYSEGQE